MIKVGITGKIAAGKSQVEKIIQNLGYKVFDLDEISRLVFDYEKIKSEILKEFQTLDRKEIGKIIFSNKDKKKKLEQIIHPELKNFVFGIFEKYKEEKVIFVSGALLFESGFCEFFDKTIFVEASDEIRLERLIKRNNLSYEDAKMRLNLQDDSNLADYIIENNTDIESLKNKTNSLINMIINQ